MAAPQGCSALVFSRRGFSELIDVSPIFEQALIRELALQCESLQRRLRMDSEHPRPPSPDPGDQAFGGNP